MVLTAELNTDVWGGQAQIKDVHNRTGNDCANKISNIVNIAMILKWFLNFPSTKPKEDCHLTNDPTI